MASIVSCHAHSESNQLARYTITKTLSRQRPRTIERKVVTKALFKNHKNRHLGMFPREQETFFNGRPSLLPPRLPRLHSHPGDFGTSASLHETRRHQDSLTSGTTSPDYSSYRPVYDRPRGRSFEEEGVHQRTLLPSLASLITPRPHVEPRQESVFDADRRQELQHLPAIPFDRRRSQTLYGEAYPASSSALAASASPRRELARGSLSGLAAFADSQLVGMRSSRCRASPSIRSRWSPYTAAVPASRNVAGESFEIPWDENEGAQHNPQRRRTSPRRRLAVSKARAQALQMAMEGEQVGLGGHFSEHAGFRERNLGPTPSLFQPPATSFGFPLPMPLRPPSPTIVDESDTSPSKKSSREMDRRTILARLDQGEKQSALAKEFRVTRAAICNLNKHRELVLSRQHKDPLAKHPKKARRKQTTEDDIEKAAPCYGNQVSLLLSDASPKHSEASRHSTVHMMALQPAELLLPLLLSSETSDAAFRRYCDRLMTLVVEEVLTWTQTLSSNTCGISIGPGGSPMLSIFQSLDPELPTGHMEFSLPHFGSVAVALDIPAAAVSHHVCLLFYPFTDTAGGVRVRVAIRELLDRGAVEKLLCLVTLAVSALTIGELQRAHPSLRIAAAHVESQEDVDAWLQQTENDQQNQNDASSTLRLQFLGTLRNS